MTLRTLNYGNYGIFLIMGNAGFCPSTVIPSIELMAKPGHPEPYKITRAASARQILIGDDAGLCGDLQDRSRQLRVWEFGV